MTEHLPVEPVKLVVAVLCSNPDALAKSCEGLRSRRGGIDHQGAARPFNLTDYYEKEMGTELGRSILSFDRLASPDELVDFKHECVELEHSLAESSGQRAVNLDRAISTTASWCSPRSRPRARKSTSPGASTQTSSAATEGGATVPSSGPFRTFQRDSTMKSSRRSANATLNSFAAERAPRD